eukprot:5362645-Prorocentrum_lima.AAC.1
MADLQKLCVPLLREVQQQPAEHDVVFSKPSVSMVEPPLDPCFHGELSKLTLRSNPLTADVCFAGGASAH